MRSSIRIRVRSDGRSQKSQPEQIAIRVVAVFRGVDEAETMLAIAQVGPAHSGHFKARFFEAVVARSRPLNRSIGNLVGSIGAGGSEGKSGLQQDMGFVPVNVVGDQHLVAAGQKRELLNKL